MEEEIGSSYDVIVLGTGFVESLIAAASARVGKKVLHLDRNNYYGGQWASFSLSNYEEWISSTDSSIPDNELPNLNDGETFKKLLPPNSIYSKVKSAWDTSVCPESKVDSEQSKLSKAELYEQNRKFNIDLAPKVLFSRGQLVELLISSNVARYVEFKCITRILTWMEGKGGHFQLINVPCSRSDVFTTDVVSPVEKRMLMRFLEFCHSLEKNEEKWEEYKGKTFKDFLAMKDHSLSEKLTHFVTSAIAMVEDDIPCKEGCEKTAFFINSLGRYGTMPFLFPLYGSGEMPQAFCRLCAVFEGVYMLRRSVEGIVVDGSSNVMAIASEGKRFDAKYYVLSGTYATDEMTQHGGKSISRAVFITDRSLFPTEKDQLTLLRMKKDEDNKTPVFCMEIGSSAGVCPNKTYLVHLTAVGQDAESDFQPTVERLFGGGEKPNILYSSYFNVSDNSFVTESDMCPKNVLLCPGPDTELDYDNSIQQAKEIFNKMFPDDEFLPRAPDPDEINFDTDEKDETEAKAE